MLPQNIARYPNCFLTLTHEQISNPCWGPRLSTHDPGIWIGSPPSFPRGFPHCSVVKNLPTIQETQETWVQFLGWQPTPVLLPGKSMDGEAWGAAVHGVAQSRMGLSDFTFTFKKTKTKNRKQNQMEFYTEN